MKRSATSVPFNIAEGSSRRTDKAFLPFLGYALSSAKELEVSLEYAKDLGFLSTSDYELLNEDLQKINFEVSSFYTIC
jgi:four helix bundle protein